MAKKPFNGRFPINESDDGYALCNASGTPISDFFDDIEYYTDDLAQVYDDNKGKYALMTQDGRILSDWYDEYEYLRDVNLTKVYDDDKEEYALMSQNGVIISDWFMEIGKFKNGYAEVVNSNEKYGLVDTNGVLTTGWVEYSSDLYADGNVDDVKDTLKQTVSQVKGMFGSIKQDFKGNSKKTDFQFESSDISKEKVLTASSIRVSQSGYKIKEFELLDIKLDSTNMEDFIEVLNTISPEMGGVANLGAFCEIRNIEQSSALLSEVEEQFIHVETERGEQPYNRLENDGSSSKPYDFDFDRLLNH